MDPSSTIARVERLGATTGQNVKMEYRWAPGHDERLLAMAVELVNRPVAVLLTGAAFGRPFQPKLPRQQFPLCSPPLAIRSNLATLQASIGPAAIHRCDRPIKGL